MRTLAIYVAVNGDKKLWIKELLYLNVFHSCRNLVSTHTALGIKCIMHVVRYHKRQEAVTLPHTHVSIL